MSVTCLTAYPGIVSSIPPWSDTFVEIDHEIIFWSFSSFLLLQEGFLSVISEGKKCVKVN